MKRCKYLLVLLLFFLIGSKVEKRKVKVIEEGKEKDKLIVYTINKIDYLNLKDVARLCGGRLSWVSITGKVFLAVNNQNIGFCLNTKKITINGIPKILKNPTHLISNIPLIPFDFISSDTFSKVSDFNFILGSEVLAVNRRINLSPPRFYSDKIVFLMAKKLLYEIQTQDKDKLRITFFQAKANPNKFLPNNKTFKEIKIEQLHKKVVCSIILTSADFSYKENFISSPPQLSLTFYLTKKTTQQPLTTIDTQTITSPQTSTFTLTSETTTAAMTTPVVEISSPVIPSVFKEKEKKKIKVVIDPGHGGIDPGAVSRNGLEEKEINLAISLELAKVFEDNGYEVYLTRTDDTFIPLVERTKFANEKKADLFISIHCNASKKRTPTSHGFEIYFLSEHASDLEAEETEALENEAIKYENLTAEQTKLQQILWSLVKNVYMNESSEICGFISREVNKRLDIFNRGVKQACFYVLRGAQMPAVLVECSFISHPVDEVRLKDRRFQLAMADSIYSGVEEYFNKKCLLSNHPSSGRIVTD